SLSLLLLSFSFLFTRPATSVIYTLSLHDALPIWCSFTGSLVTKRTRIWPKQCDEQASMRWCSTTVALGGVQAPIPTRMCSRMSRSEEHTSELQSLRHLVCRLLLEKKKKRVKKEIK